MNPARTASFAIAAALCLCSQAFAAEPAKVVPAPAGYKLIPLGSEGSPSTERWEDSAGWRRAYDVTQPALYPVLPKAGSANGTAVVIAPGGGFTHLSMDSEGLTVAVFRAVRGIAAFVLNYRVTPAPAPGAGAEPKPSGQPQQASAAVLNAQADAIAAMKWVRSHAATFGVKPDRIGFMGFSAGGMTTTNLVLNYDKASRPDFVGVIYGRMIEGGTVPADAPPAFFAVAADDPLLGKASIPMYEAWRAAGKDAELHIYAHGKHGFGMRAQGTSSDRWAEDFYSWLRAEIIR
jgi:acetyl esterase/lipase